jgi:hypothetical protein
MELVEDTKNQLAKKQVELDSAKREVRRGLGGWVGGWGLPDEKVVLFTSQLLHDIPLLATL